MVALLTANTITLTLINININNIKKLSEREREREIRGGIRERRKGEKRKGKKREYITNFGSLTSDMLW